jgi:hypothetical protein
MTSSRVVLSTLSTARRIVVARLNVGMTIAMLWSEVLEADNETPHIALIAWRHPRERFRLTKAADDSCETLIWHCRYAVAAKRVWLGIDDSYFGAKFICCFNVLRLFQGRFAGVTRFAISSMPATD